MAKAKKKIAKEFLVLKLDEIHPYENNPRINDEAVQHVKQSIQQCSDLDPIEVDEKNVVLSGHTRLMAMQELGYEEADCIRYTGLTKEQKKKYRLLANKVAEKSFWDYDKLSEELKDLDFGDFDFGFASLDDHENYVDDYFDRGVEAKEKKEEFGVKVQTETEEAADELLERLQSEGYTCTRI